MKKILVSFLVLLSVIAFASDRAYYEQFFYAEENVSDDPDFPAYQYRWLQSGLGVNFTAANGKKMNVSVDIAMYPDGTYKMKYRENELYDNGTFWQTTCKEVNGKWDVPADRLELDGDLAFGFRHFANETNQVKLKMNQVLGSSEVKDLDLPLELGYSNAPADILLKCFPF